MIQRLLGLLFPPYRPSWHRRIEWLKQLRDAA